MRNAPIALGLLLCVSGAGHASEVHSDLVRAMKTWTEADVASYSFKIRHVVDGCEYSDWSVVVIEGQDPVVLQLDPPAECEAVAGYDLHRGWPTVDQLLGDIARFYALGEPRSAVAVDADFSAEYGYPAEVRFAVNDSAVPIQTIQYSILDFQAWADGK